MTRDPDTAAIAVWRQAGDLADPLIGDQHVPQLAAKPLASFDDRPVDDHAAAEAGADDRRDGGRPVPAKNRKVPPERAGIAVVQVRDGLEELALERGADIETGPVRVDEIRGAAGAEHTCRARRARRIEADRDDLVEKDLGAGRGDRQAFRNLLQADIRPLLRAGGVLAQAVDQPVAVGGDERVVDGGSAEIDTSCDAHAYERSLSGAGGEELGASQREVIAL